MLRTPAARAARSEIAALCADAPDHAALLTRAAAIIRRAVPFDAAGLCTLDPGTQLWTGGLLAGEMPAEVGAAFYENELFADDVLKYSELRLRKVPVGSIVSETGGDVTASHRYRTTFAPHGFGDELRVMFGADGEFWGEGCLLRDEPFTGAEMAFVASLGKHLAHGLATARPPAGDAAAASDGPGVLLVDEAVRVLSLTGEAGRWLGELGWQGDAEDLPWVVRSVAARARACLLGGADGPPRARLRGASGRWLCVHASPWPAGGFSVVIEPARPAEVLPLVCRAHGLTPREQDALGLMLQGATDREIAARLVVSDHTAREYTRAVLRKVGVRTRVELQATLFADSYTPWAAFA